MKNKEWEIKNLDKNYKINLFSSSKVIINEEEFDLKNLKSDSLIFTINEYKLPISDMEVFLSNSFGKWKLIVNGKDYDTSKEYTFVSNIPKWIYLFLLLNAVNFINGAVGACLAILGMILSLKVCTMRTNIFVKVLLCFSILIISFILVFIIALMLNLLIY